MFSKVSRKPVQLSEEEISKILRKVEQGQQSTAGSQSLQNKQVTTSGTTGPGPASAGLGSEQEQRREQRQHLRHAGSPERPAHRADPRHSPETRVMK